ncbi:MAG TPA: hypothetical protein PLB31_02605 [Fimbriimonadaceae bacterium]|nr:hypothetical protein [Armatimonadota bacterium]HCM73918.1 hypothetical protein [Armatimonadota bacterium]HRD32015.1 hypothetical protein [Fimbriimonadaceae bacterium]HRE92690.1 hypothetical protein [Fimbriimonadaceae bacterium]HRI73341.1 hypothetical protein [Fimbriimonadaceae bacterium]
MARFKEAQWRSDWGGSRYILVAMAIAGAVAYGYVDNQIRYWIYYSYFVVGGILFLFFSKMTTMVNEHELRISIGVIPIPRYRLPLSQVASTEKLDFARHEEINKYFHRVQALRKFWTGNKMGVAVILRSGRTVMIGSRSPNRLMQALGAPDATAPLSTSSPEY